MPGASVAEHCSALVQPALVSSMTLHQSRQFEDNQLTQIKGPSPSSGQPNVGSAPLGKQGDLLPPTFIGLFVADEPLCVHTKQDEPRIHI